MTTGEQETERASDDHSDLPARVDAAAALNRLSHALSAAGTYQENLIAAESRIRDVDMAKEMVEYTKFSILAQAGQSMLAQANQAPQGVLQLLR